MLRHKELGFLPFIALIAISICASILVVDPFTTPDFTAYVSAVKAFAAGENPYAVQLSPNPYYRFYSPPYVFGVLLWLAWIDSSMTSQLFVILFTISVILSAILLYDVYLRSLELSPIRSVAIALLTTPYGLIFHGLTWGTLSWNPLLGVSLFLWFWKKRRPLVAGAALFLLLLRPHQEILLLSYLILFFLTKSWKTGATLFLGLLFCLLVVFLFNPSTIPEYQLFANSNTHYHFTTVTVPSILMGHFALLNYTLFVSVIAQIVLAYLLRNMFNLSPIVVVPLFMSLSILFGPYAWFHDYLTCLPALYLAGQGIVVDLRANRRSDAAMLCCILFFLNIMTTFFAFNAGNRELAAYYYFPSLLSYLLLLYILCRKIVRPNCFMIGAN